MYYLCFSVNRLPDLTLTKYSVFDGSGVEDIMDKHGVFLRQLHRLGFTSGVYFHLLYYYNPDKNKPKGHHLLILFYATSNSREKLERVREFLITSVLSTYYDFLCYEVSSNFYIEEEKLSDGSVKPLLKMKNISGKTKVYSLGDTSEETVKEAAARIKSGEKSHIVCEIASDSDVVLSFDRMPVDERGRIICDKKFACGAFLTKKDYWLPAQNRLNTDTAGEIPLYSIMEWEPCETGRLYNVLKLMEGYDQSAVLRIDIFPVEHAHNIRKKLPYADTRRRISDRTQGKDDNSENIIKSWDKYLNNLMKFPQFLANVVAFSDSEDIAIMLADSVAAEAVESGTYLIETIKSERKLSMYESDTMPLHREIEDGNYVAPFLSLFTLEEMRPMFSFPILYPGESIECLKETDPRPFKKEVVIDSETGKLHEVISLGVSSMGYDVTFPVKLFEKHAFIAGVPGSGKTNTMLYLVTTLWRDTKQKVPFLVLEPAKQEYRALANIKGMEEVCIFSPGADTRFPLHINPFQFPVGLTLAEHIANLNAVFAGAFELIPPSPFLIDGCIEKVYLDKGWNINERNTGQKEYPTMQELYDSLKIAVEESGYEGESKANIRSVMEVRIGSLLRREIGNVYNVRKSSMEPEDWLNCPAIIELEALGEGPANFMSLLISTLIREVLKIRKTSDIKKEDKVGLKREIEHIIFYEEAHNLIGPNTDDPVGGSVDPKISATKYLVKMLAEVRALGEGIVIADQLPTAMAPEVLKNTGLKLGHRITAQDDRNLLGSTMSASAEQLEEQGTFKTGQALIFYEDLLKPFKMRVCEWEKGVPKKKYKSPTNMELFEKLKDNETYKILLSNSADIMKEKMDTEFELLRIKAKEVKKSINKKLAEIEGAENSVKKLKNKLERATGENERETVKKHISEMERTLRERQDTMDGPITRDFKKLCWNYCNLYYAYMTLSNNYYIHADDMYMCTVENFLSLFGVMKSLITTPKLQRILLEETKEVTGDIIQWVDIDGLGNGKLSEHPVYNRALFEAGAYLMNIINADLEESADYAAKLVEKGIDAKAELEEFCKIFSDGFSDYIKLAEKFRVNALELADALGKTLAQSGEELNEKDRARAEGKVLEYRNRSTVLYKAAAAYAVNVFRQLAWAADELKSFILSKTVEVRTEIKKVINYRSRSSQTVLSSDGVYVSLWKTSESIMIMEIKNTFRNLNKLMDSKLGNMTANNLDISAVKEVILQYNVAFKMYSGRGTESADCNYILAAHYTNFLNTVMGLGEGIYKTIIDLSENNWSVCCHMIQELQKAQKVTVDVNKKWEKLSRVMTAMIKKVKGIV